MNSSTQFLVFLSGLAILSLVTWLLCRAATGSRLAILRAYIVLTWAALGTFFLLSLFQVETVLRISMPLKPLAESLSRTRLVSWEDDPVSLSQVLVAIYLLGLTYGLIRCARSYFQLFSWLKTAHAKQSLGREIWVHEEVETPFTFGFLRPRIFASPKHLKAHGWNLILIHEDIHRRRRDPAWKLFSILTRTLLFFLPTAGLLERLFELELEIACDRETLSKSGASLREYGQVLLTALPKNQQPMLVSISDHQITRRILAMKNTHKSRPALNALLIGLMIVFGTGTVALAAPTATLGLPPQYYKINMEVRLAGELIATPSIMQVADHEALIEVGGPNHLTRIRLTPSNVPMRDAAVDLKMNIEIERGNRHVIASPRLIVLQNERASISTEDLEISVTATQ